MFSFIVKSVVDHGWYWSNPNVGAPSGLQMLDYAVSAHDCGHLLLVKIMSLFSGDWALIFNVYFLIGFPLIALSAMAVFRHFKVSYLGAIVGSVLYSFLPSRTLKGEAHLFLDTFFQVPLAVLLLLSVYGDNPPMVAEGSSESSRPRLDLRSRRSLFVLAICGIIASTSAYYASFTILLLLPVAVLGSLRCRSIRNAISGLIIAGVVVIGLGLNGLPTMVYHARYGPNAAVGERQSWEAESYGLKVTQLLLPVAEHRVSALATIKREYDETAPLNGEVGSTTLGIFGSLGFIVLLGVALSAQQRPPAPRKWEQQQILNALATLTIIAVLLGTIGGFGSLIAIFISPQIRSYCRLNVFIGFFSIFAVVLIVDRFRPRYPRATALALLSLLVVGLFDENSLLVVRRYDITKRQYQSDDALVRRVERVVPPGTAVFELPFSPFPEPPTRVAMSGYSPVRAYLHSRSLHWSYPAMRGRGSDAWVQDVSGREPDSMAERVSDAGFGGILIDRDGYTDRATALERSLQMLLGVAPLVSEAQNLSFYSLLEYNRRRHSGESPADREDREDLAKHPVSMTWGKGFWEIETEANRTLRWARAESELLITNASTRWRRVSFSMTVAAAHPPAHLRTDGDLLAERVALTEGGLRLVRTVDVAPGTHLIRFTCDGQRADAPSDPRTLVWSVENFVVDEIRTALSEHPPR